MNLIKFIHHSMVKTKTEQQQQKNLWVIVQELADADKETPDSLDTKHPLLIDSLSNQVTFYFQSSKDFLTGVAAKTGDTAVTRTWICNLSEILN